MSDFSKFFLSYRFRRFRFFCPYVVLLSFFINILMSSYAFAAMDVALSHDVQNDAYRFGSMVRVSKYSLTPSLTACNPNASVLPDAFLTGSEYSQSTLAEVGIDDDVLSQCGLSDADSLESNDPDILWFDAGLQAPSASPSTLSSSIFPAIERQGGYILSRDERGDLSITCDPMVSPDERLDNMMTITNPGGLVCLDGLGSLTSFTIRHAKGLRFKGHTSIQNLSLDLDDVVMR